MITKIDEISGTEVPKKCCENCEWHKKIFRTGSYAYDFRRCYGANGGVKWNYREDFCSRFELKEDEKWMDSVN